VKPRAMRKVVGVYLDSKHPLLLLQLRKNYHDKWAGKHKGRLRCLRILEDAILQARTA